MCHASLLCLLASSAGCGKTAASALAPDFAGEWDVTYDDALDFELRLPGVVQRVRLAEMGGQFVMGDAGSGLDIDVDCTRPELVCPAEVWPRELTLAQDQEHIDDGRQLAQPIHGMGIGRCASQAGSVISSEIVTVAKPDSVRHEAVALTNGRIVTVHDANCFAPLAGLPAGSQVVLATGFTAAKR
ncbi:MAG TPA: hypothetical protein VI299_21825 [Polyangiales bacterium]